jgi:lysophospholipase L1-like esterase
MPTHQEGRFYHSKQLAVTYRHAANCWNGPQSRASSQLPATRAKLASASAVKLVIFGDSISVGYNASGFASPEFGLTPTAPYLPTWAELVAKQLRAHYGVEVELSNGSVSGTTSRWAVQNVHAAVSEHRPDLAVIAFGMNDGSAGIPADEFQANIQALIDDVRAANSACEFILVSPMLANPLWSSAGDQRQYLVGLEALAKAPGIALADLTRTHAKLLERKRYVDMTGNGLNHPNDFLIRWYAQHIAGLLGAL